MGLSASLNGFRITSARVHLPAFGAWYVEASLDTEQTIAKGAAAKVVLSDLTLVGTVLSGGPEKGRSDYIVIGGKGGWANDLPKKSYANDLGVKLSTILSDAATAVGETIDLGSRSAEKVGPAYVRKQGPAARLLERHAPGAWYVDSSGTTKLGRRAASTLSAKVPRVSPVDHARGTVTLAPETLADLQPGVVVDGLEAVDVIHEISAKAGLRSTVWGKRGGGFSRRLQAFRDLLNQLDPDRDFRAVWEYRVVTQSGDRLNLQPVRASSGMPDLSRVPVRPGVAGAKSNVTLGSKVLVGFIDAQPSRPVVLAQEEVGAEGYKPILTTIDATTFVKLADGARLMPATGDLAGGIWPIVGTTRVMG